MKTENSNIIVEKNSLKTKKQRILHILCLIVPIIGAFAGYFIAPKDSSEIIKFLFSAVLFLLFAVVIFILTRKENPIIKIILKDALLLTY